MEQSERSQLAKEINAVVAPYGAEAHSWRIENDGTEVAIFPLSGNSPFYIKGREDWQARQPEIIRSLVGAYAHPGRTRQ